MAEARKVTWIIGGAAVAVAVGLSGLSMLFPGYLTALPEQARQGLWPGGPFLSPLFSIPLVTLAVWARRLPVWGAVGLVLAIVVIHVGAVTTTMAVYIPRMPPLHILERRDEPPAERAARYAHDSQTAQRAGALAGAAGGAVGGLASLLVLGLALRPRRLLAPTLGGTAVLAGIGALGVSRLMLHSGAAPTAFVWQAAGLCLVWQAVLGVLFVYMLRTPRPVQAR